MSAYTDCRSIVTERNAMNILFICTHNRCRSILAEAICRHISQESKCQLKVYSAGSQPEGIVHLMSLQHLSSRGISTQGLQSQSWHDFNDINFDIAITVCDSAAGESCPLYLGSALKVHWPLSDPSKLDAAAQGSAFNTVIDELERRLKLATAYLKQGDVSAKQFQEKLIAITA